MVAACTAWADWKHRRATKTACDPPVGHPPPPVCTVTRVLWGKREGGCSSSVSVCIHQVWERRQMFVSTIVRRTCPRVPRPPKDSTGREMHEVSECMPWVLQAASRPPPRPRPPPPPTNVSPPPQQAQSFGFLTPLPMTLAYRLWNSLAHSPVGPPPPFQERVFGSGLGCVCARACVCVCVWVCLCLAFSFYWNTVD